MADEAVGKSKPTTTAGPRIERRRRSADGEEVARARAAVSDPEPEAEPQTEPQTGVDVPATKEGTLNLKNLKERKISELAQIARNFNVEGAPNMRKQELIFAILQAQTEQNGFIYGEGVLEILPDGFGFLRAPDYNYLPGSGRHLRLAQPDPPLQPAHRRRRRPGRSGRRRRASAISRCSRSRRSTTRSRSGRARRSSSTT